MADDGKFSDHKSHDENYEIKDEHFNLDTAERLMVHDANLWAVIGAPKNKEAKDEIINLEYAENLMNRDFILERISSKKNSFQDMLSLEKAENTKKNPLEKYINDLKHSYVAAISESKKDKSVQGRC